MRNFVVIVCFPFKVYLFIKKKFMSNKKSNSKKESLWQKHLWRKIDARVNKTEIKESDHNSRVNYEISTLNLILLFISYIIGLFFYAIF